MTAYLESDAGLMLPRSKNGHALSESVRGYEATIDLMESRIWQLELELSEHGWTRLSESGGNEFTRAALRQITDLARVNYLKNPLIKRSVEIGALYVWGQDLSVNAANDEVKAVTDRFWKENRSTLTGQQASRLMEVELEVTGNVFLALFPNRVTGSVRVRPVPMEEIHQIICNPEDRSDVWYYKRTWTEQEIGSDATTTKTALYPDWHYAPDAKPTEISSMEIRWDSPLLHVKAGAFPHWRWGVSEVYAALDWAKAYKEQLEDDATRSRALARFAWSLTTKGGKQGVSTAKTKLGTTYANGGATQFETNPPPLTGSTFISTDGVDMKPMSIANAMLPPDHSRPARLMAAAATGIPDHFFDPAIGNHATAKTMDRPTELRFNERRQMWRDVLSDLFQWVIDADLAAVRGLLTKALSDEDRKVDIAFPDILQPDTNARITAIATAVTDGGSADAGTLPSKLKSRLYMQELGVDDIDAQMKELDIEQAARDQKAADIAKQTAANPPPDPAKPQPPDPNAPPIKPTEAALAEVNTDGSLTLSDLLDVVSWFDTTNPQHKGLLNAVILPKAEG